MPTIINQKNGKIVIHATANVNSNVASFALSGENYTDIQVSQVFWSANTDVFVKRGSNTLLYFPPNSTGGIDFAGEGMALSQDSSANVVITIGNGGAGFVLLELTKMIEYPATYDYYEN
jgi:hypothetical protein